MVLHTRCIKVPGHIRILLKTHCVNVKHSIPLWKYVHTRIYRLSFVPSFYSFFLLISEKIDTAELRFEIDKWKRNVNKWAGGSPKWSLAIISYDKLVSDFKTELQKIVRSLNFPVKKESIDCLLHNTMDAHQRNKEKGENPYSKEQESIIRQAILSLEDIWQSHNISYQEWVW